MGFWIFMLFIALLIPLTMVVFGSIFYKNAPKKINPIFGYRTTMSMKNNDTWSFAHRLIGKIWLIVGSACTILSTVCMIFVVKCDKETIGTMGEIITIACVFVIILTIIPVEVALKRNFDENGNKKSPKN